LNTKGRARLNELKQRHYQGKGPDHYGRIERQRAEKPYHVSFTIFFELTREKGSSKSYLRSPDLSIFRGWMSISMRIYTLMIERVKNQHIRNSWL